MTLYPRDFEEGGLSFNISSTRVTPTSIPVFYISRVKCKKECLLQNHEVLVKVGFDGEDGGLENVRTLTKQINESLLKGPTVLFFSGETITNPINVESCFDTDNLVEPHIVKMVDEWTRCKRNWITLQCTQSKSNDKNALTDYNDSGDYIGLRKLHNIRFYIISSFLLTFCIFPLEPLTECNNVEDKYDRDIQNITDHKSEFK